MTLSKMQYEEIEVYLETKGIHQIDIAYEILDHITSGVESSMEGNKLDFEEAFKLEQIKWESELSSFQFTSYNIDFKTPKIVLRRYWEMLREMYTKATIMAVGAFLSISIFIKTDLAPIESFNTVFGYFYLAVVVAIALGFFNMKQKDANTVDRMLFKATMGYFMAWLVVFNPLFTNMYWVGVDGQFRDVFLCIHVFLLCFSFNFIDLYKAHIKKVKLYSV